MTTIKIKRGSGAPTVLAEGELAIDVTGEALYVNAKTLSGDADNIVRVGNEILDDDTFATASATTVASSESIKAYVDTEVAAQSASGIAGLSTTATTTVLTLSDSQVTIDSLITAGQGKFKGTGAGASRNTAFGFDALDSVTPTDTDNGRWNTGIGYRAGVEIVTGEDNTVLGADAFSTAVHSLACTAIGARCLTNYNGTHSFRGVTGVGMECMESLTTGSANTAVGQQSLKLCTTGSWNTTLGYYSGYSVTGDLNTIIGFDAGSSVTSGDANTFVGANAGDNVLTTSSSNVALGYDALSTGAGTQSYNTAVGTSALKNNTGNSNTAVGYRAGNLTTTGTNNTSIGNDSDPSSATASNEVTLGNTSITALRCAVTSITALSDARDKTAVEPLKGASDFIKALNPVSFEWNQRDGNRIGQQDHGFIAQDLQAVQSVTGYEVPRLVMDENPEKLEAAYGTLLPTIVAALQEALAEIEILKAQLGNA